MAAKLSDFLSKLPGEVEEGRDGWLSVCPAHNDTNPSLRVTVSATGKVLVKCRVGCDTTEIMGRVGMTMRDLTTMFPDVQPAYKASAQDAPASPADVAKLRVKLEGYAAAFPGSPAAAYAAERFGVTEEAAKRWMLGYVDYMVGSPRLIIPFMDANGMARGYQGRALDPDADTRWASAANPSQGTWAKTAWFSGNGEHSGIVITEGPGDAMSAAMAGFDAVAVRGAGLAKSNAANAELVRLLGDRPVYLAGDADRAGQAFNDEVGAMLGVHGYETRVLELPTGKDLSDVRKADPEGFAIRLSQMVLDAPLLESDEALLNCWDETTYSLSDIGGARYLRDFIERRGSGVKYTSEAGFYLLEGSVWRQDVQQRTRTYVHELADLARATAGAANRRANRENASDHDKALAKRFNAFYHRISTSNGVEALLRELQAVEGVGCSINDFDRHPDLLAVANGVVNLRTGELLPPDASLMLSRKVPHAYDPEARAPRFERFMEEIFPKHHEMPAYMQRLIGYGITGHAREECFAVFYGRGANGKSVLCSTLSHVFDEQVTSTPFSTFETRQSGAVPNDLAALKGARLVLASEGEQGKPMAESVLKRVTGQDPVSARFMHKEFFTFDPTFLLLLASNYKPAFRGADDGLWRRVKLIPFQASFKDPAKRDKLLPAKLRNEAEGILRWAVEGARQWYARGLEDPIVVKEATREYRETSDALSGFLPGVYVPAPHSTKRIPGKQLYADYKAWVEEEGMDKAEVWRRRTFYSALEERGLTRRGTGDGIAFEGVVHHTRADDAPDHLAEEVAPQEGDAQETPIATPSRSDVAGLDDVF